MKFRNLHTVYCSRTVLKLQDFPATQILREINICESVVSKSAILSVSTRLKSIFSEYFHFVKAETYPNPNSEPLKLSKY